MTLFFALPFLPGGNLEWFIVVMAALMIFGSRLPEVALRAVAHIMRIRRAISKMWRDTGLEDELRRVRRDIELSIPRESDFDLKPKPIAPPEKGGEVNDARAAAERAREAAERNARAAGGAGNPEAQEDADVDPDAHRRGGFRLEAADGTVAQGDELSFDAAASDARDEVPGFDRQEPAGYDDGEADRYYDEPSAAAESPAESPAEPPAESPAESPSGPEPAPQPDLGGSHFGAGVQPRPKDD